MNKTTKWAIGLVVAVAFVAVEYSIFKGPSVPVSTEPKNIEEKVIKKVLPTEEANNTNNKSLENNSDSTSVDKKIEQNQINTSNGSSAICGRVWYIPGAVGYESGGIANDNINVFKAGKLVATAVTDEDGNFKIDNLQVDEYIVTDEIYSTSVTIKTAASQCVKAEITIAAPSYRY